MAMIIGQAAQTKNFLIFPVIPFLIEYAMSSIKMSFTTYCYLHFPLVLFVLHETADFQIMPMHREYFPGVPLNKQYPLFQSEFPDQDYPLIPFYGARQQS